MHERKERKMNQMKADDREIMIGARAPAFLVYCRTIGQGSSGPAVNARIVLAIGGKSANECLKKLEEQLASGNIDGTSYANRVEAVEEIQSMFERGVQTHVDPCLPVSGWVAIPGGHQRKMYNQY